MIGLNIRDRSSIDLPGFKCMRQSWIVRRIAFSALLLTAGRKLTKCLPYRFFALRGLKVYPRKSNLISELRSVRSSSLQYTMRVLVGCSSSPHSRNLTVNCSSNFSASSFVLQCANPSSAYRIQGVAGQFLFIHVSNV